MSISFDLDKQPWIPCVDAGGARLELGLRDALLRAHELRGLHDESPLVVSSLLRLLLAFVHAATRGPNNVDEWAALWKAGRLPPDKVEAYLDRWHERLDLFSPTYPFLQVAGFTVEGSDGTPVAKLAAERATGSNATLFDHTVEKCPVPISAAAAARGLVASQAYALAGGQGATSQFGKHPYFAHAPMVRGTALFLEGTNLFETLALNLLITSTLLPSGDLGVPVWELADVGCPALRRPSGYLEYLTWRSRFVRLLADEDATGVRVLGMHYSQGWVLDEKQRNPVWAYKYDDERGELAVRSSKQRALWRDAAAIFSLSRPSAEKGRAPLAFRQTSEMVQLGYLPSPRALSCIAVTLRNDDKQAAKIDFWRLERLPVSSRTLADPSVPPTLERGLLWATAAEGALGSATRLICKRFRDGLQGLRQRAPRAYWAGLEGAFLEFLSAAPIDGEAALNSWCEAVKSAARLAYEQETDNLQRRSAREMAARVAGRGVLEAGLSKLTLTTGMEEA